MLKPNKIRIVRVLTYEGSGEWLSAMVTRGNNFVPWEGERDIGNGNLIKSTILHTDVVLPEVDNEG